MSRTPRGWYQDPSGRHQLRWWTGTAWAAAVADDGVEGSDVDGLRPGAQPWPRAEPTDRDVAEVVRSVHAGALPGSGPLDSAVLTVWRRRDGLVSLHPTWSVHDGVGTWLGTITSGPAGAEPVRTATLHRAGTGPLRIAAEVDRAAGRVVGDDGTEIAAAEPDPAGGAAVLVTVDGMVVARAVLGAGEVAVTDGSGATVARMVPTPLKVRRSVGRRVGWDPVMVAEQTGVADPVTGRGVNSLALVRALTTEVRPG